MEFYVGVEMTFMARNQTHVARKNMHCPRWLAFTTQEGMVVSHSNGPFKIS